MAEEWIPIIMFLCIAAVMVVSIWLRFRSRDAMQQTIRLALDKGHELTPEIIDRLGHPKAGKNKDLRLGVIWLSIAVGLALIATSIGYFERDAFFGVIAGAALPFAIGLGYLVLHRFAREDD